MSELTNSTQAQSAPYTGPERRRAPRYPGGENTFCHLHTELEGECFWPRVHNISAVGISLIVHRRIDLGRMMQLRLENRACSLVYDLQIRVVTVIELPDDSFLVGGAFNRPLTEDELKTLL